jgi:hypothetical protein
VKLSRWSRVEGADERRAIPISRSRVSRDWRGRVGSHDSRTREIASCEKDLWIDKLQIPAEESKGAASAQGDRERSCERISARGPIGLERRND